MTENRVNDEARVVLSFDDCSPRNIDLGRMVADVGLIATFFLETLGPGAEEQARALHSMGHSIGSHTMTHPADLKRIPIEEARTEIFASKGMVERWTGRPCTAFCYPRGRFNDEIVSLVREAGYESARTTHVLKTEIEDPLRAPTTVHVLDGRKEYNGRSWRSVAPFYWDDVRRRGGTFHLWGHALEIYRDRQEGQLRAFLKRVVNDLDL